MKICIDARPLQNGHRSRGVGILVSNLLRAMGPLLSRDEVSLITQRGAVYPPFFYQERRLPTFRLDRPNRFNWMADQLFLPALIIKSGAELFLATDFNSYMVPRNGVKVVSLAYDMIPFIFPEAMTSQPLSVRLGWRANFIRIQKSSAVIAISQATKDDLVRMLEIEPERIHVVYPGIDHSLFNMDNASNVTRKSEVLERYGIAGRYLLYVGDSEWRKNLRRVLEALAGIEREVKLVLVGKSAPADGRLQGWLDDLGLRGRVVTPGFVPEVDLPPLYGAATAFIFPTLYEGFGIPILEAMACGCPVITSSVSSMPEVAGTAGLLVNPLEVAGIRNAIVQVLGDEGLRRRMIDEGKQQAAGFSWERCAAATLAVLREVLSGG